MTVWTTQGLCHGSCLKLPSGQQCIKQTIHFSQEVARIKLFFPPGNNPSDHSQLDASFLLITTNTKQLDA